MEWFVLLLLSFLLIVLKFEMEGVILKILYCLFMVYPYEVLLARKSNNELSLKKKNKHEMLYTAIIYKSVVIIPCIFFVICF